MVCFRQRFVSAPVRNLERPAVVCARPGPRNPNARAALGNGTPPGVYMAELTFRCPYSNRPIKTGIDVDRADAQRIRAFPIRIRCPYCDCSHDGTVADAELEDAA